MRLLGAFCLWIWLACSAHATWTLVQSGHGGQTGASQTFVATFSSGITAGNVVVGIFGWDMACANTVSSIKDNAATQNTYTGSSIITDTTNTQNSELFWLANVTNGGATTITVTMSSNNCLFGKIIAEEWHNSAGSSPGSEGSGSLGGGSTGQFQASPGTTTNAITSGAFSTTTNGDLVWSGNMDSSSTTTASAGTGYSLDFSNNTDGGYSMQGESLTLATAGSSPGTWTRTVNDATVTFVIAFKPPAGAAACENTLALLGVGC